MTTPMPNPDLDKLARGLTEDCDNHTPSPEGYIQWHAWAAEMSKTHTQRKCQECGLYAIWEPKPALKAHIERNEG